MRTIPDKMADIEISRNGCSLGFGTRTTLNMIRTRFPNVPQISTDELAAIVRRESSDESERKLVLLDTRSKSEFSVSHLPNAISVNPDISDIKDVINLIDNATDSSEEQKTVVAYCSIGYRSSAIVDRLMKELGKPEQKAIKNKMNLYNLEGSIFKWANERRHIVNNNNVATIYVHPYNAVWGKLLDHELRSYEPKL